MSNRDTGNECLEEAKSILGFEEIDEASLAFGSWMKKRISQRCGRSR